MWAHPKKILSLDINSHLIIAISLRLVLILYGNVHDQIFKVPYTDVDYTVFTDGSRHILDGNSPYKRHTYRYSPMLAMIMTPNIFMHKSFGKLVFSIFDILAGFIIYNIVKCTLSSNSKDTQKELLKYLDNNTGKSLENSLETIELKSKISAIFWLYNPSVFIITTRGNCDAIASVLVLLTIYLLQCKNMPLLTGLVHGFAIHFRLYPLMYSLSFFMYFSTFSYKSKNKTNLEIARKNVEVNKMEIQTKKTILKKEYFKYLIPNFNQLKLVFGTLLTLTLFTVIFYIMYGYEFLHETYVYHLIRKDTRHNFSLYFYMQYLSADIKNVSYWQKVLTVLPQYILILVLSIRYGLNKSSLNFSLFTITFVMITYNTVLTSQYFMWLMVLLPLCIWQIKINKVLAVLLFTIWIVSQAAWLYPAYLLEFNGKNTFIYIWIQSVAFFSANIGILGKIIQRFQADVT